MVNIETTNNPKDKKINDCLSCRLTGGATLFAISGFLASNRKYMTGPLSRLTLSACSVSVAYLAIARLFSLPPFPNPTNQDFNSRTDISPDPGQ